ncbi:MAG: tRNA pseudouridine32 synthase/23S rRNA pseudouridine746 synthase [Gammaproteobacteria bacterium]
MSISRFASKLSLPQRNPGVTTVLEYLVVRFGGISPDVWRQRIADGKVHWHDGTRITAQTAYRPQQRVYYYREVSAEASVPFVERIIYRDADLLVARKPHFLAVTPGGVHVNECLQSRLRDKTGIDSLQVLHRLDRLTAGLVMCSLNPATRHHYHRLFATRTITKTYRAVARVSADNDLVGRQWELKNRIVVGEPRFRMQVAPGVANSHSVIRCLRQHGDLAEFELNPVTGKTHQLRVHMHALGWPILHDSLYPDVQPERDEHYERPLQLAAVSLRFVDPVTQLDRHFTCEANLIRE